MNLGLSSTGALPETTNKVLRDTYRLLALSMLPTVAGAWLGVETGLLNGMGAGLGAMVFLGGAFGFMYAIEKTKHSQTGVAVLLAFTFFMGLMLSRMLGFVLTKSGGAEAVALTFLSTASVFGTMAVLSSTIKKDVSSWGKGLVIGAVLLIVASLSNIFFQSSVLQLVVSLVASVLFSVFILYDLKRVRSGAETNYISATLGIYLSLYNVFSSLLSIFGMAADD